MAKRASDPRSTSDRLLALRDTLPDLIAERPDPRLHSLTRRTAEGLFADVQDEEERAQCLRAFAEFGIALGVPATLVRDALELSGAPRRPRKAPLRAGGGE
ncbi:hypothetical protein ACFOED_13605 [Vulcaniibacterium thermophilum]|jgi:hypothetical protein|uniref:Uncharacterized protein n=1 Tax=Vulcaniibacterium thermophilum TaxID=1169913 RepID=A0A918Z0H4_9GAMM|nr:hypothetical protein [Vulcaniibacterium thermophilum]GHE32459.1 hypothetical protein GCM10007167_12990 [Vulcaniibacterium thermophilum]